MADSPQSGPSTVAAIFIFPLGLSAFSIYFFLSLSYTFFSLWSWGFWVFLLLQSNLEQGKMSKLIWKKRWSWDQSRWSQALWTVCPWEITINYYRAELGNTCTGFSSLCLSVKIHWIFPVTTNLEEMKSPELNKGKPNPLPELLYFDYKDNRRQVKSLFNLQCRLTWFCLMCKYLICVWHLVSILHSIALWTWKARNFVYYHRSQLTKRVDIVYTHSSTCRQTHSWSA